MTAIIPIARPSPSVTRPARFRPCSGVAYAVVMVALDSYRHCLTLRPADDQPEVPMPLAPALEQ